MRPGAPLEAAVVEYRAGLNPPEEQSGFDRGEDEPYAHLASLRMPGPDYLAWLEWLQRTLSPESYVEIGVGSGRSLALAQPPTLAIGVDPAMPAAPLSFPIATEAHLYPQASDDFFAERRLERLLLGYPVRLAFIDGLHTFEQALRDFINLELHCGPRSVVAFHDTVPLDETTQARDQTTSFWTGDVWKAVVCLRHYRPELQIATIATPPTGLTLVLGLDKASSILLTALEEAIERFMSVPFSTIEHQLESALNIVPNDWNVVRSWLASNRVIDYPKSDSATLQ